MKMTRVRVEGFTISLDGYGDGMNQDIRNPLGVGGTDLHQWLVPTRTFQRTLFGADGGTTGIDDDFAARGFKNVGAWILGRNMRSEEHTSELQSLRHLVCRLLLE